MRLKKALLHFGLWVNGLVSENCYETIKEIEKQIEEENIVEYIGKKYKDKVDFSLFNQDGPYPPNEINRFFLNQHWYIHGNESRKFCVSDNGLCLITAVCLDGIANC